MIERVKVVKYQSYRDGGTVEYRDIHNRVYVVPHKRWNDTSIYSDHPQHMSMSPEYRDDIRLKDIELEIVKSFEDDN